MTYKGFLLTFSKVNFSSCKKSFKYIFKSSVSIYCYLLEACEAQIRILCVMGDWLGKN